MLDVGGCEDLVDIVFGESFARGKRKTRPYYAVRIKGREEESKGRGGDVIGQGAVGEGHAGEVEEGTALSTSLLVSISLRRSIEVEEWRSRALHRNGSGSSLSSSKRVLWAFR